MGIRNDGKISSKKASAQISTTFSVQGGGKNTISTNFHQFPPILRTNKKTLF